MYLICLDLEGVLIPEIWPQFAESFNIEELKLTTKDFPDFNLLMSRRLKILQKHKIKIKDLQKVLKKIKPLKGAIKFLKSLQKKFPVIILTDSFYEFVNVFSWKFHFPTIFCNYFIVDKKGMIRGYRRVAKELWVKTFKRHNFKIIAIGDSFNDLNMLKEADVGILFAPFPKINSIPKKIFIAKNYSDCLKKIKMIT